MNTTPGYWRLTYINTAGDRHVAQSGNRAKLDRMYRWLSASARCKSIELVAI